MSGAAFWIGDRMYGVNRFTDEVVEGKLTKLETSDLDGKVYALVETRDGERAILAADLRGPRWCNKPTPREPWDGTCARCGRDIYVNGPYDAESYTHHLSRVPGRYR